jgi:hypothetical protein
MSPPQAESSQLYLSDFYSYRLIGKLTGSLQLQEFSFRNMIVASSTSAARLSINSSKAGLVMLPRRIVSP